MNYQLFNESGTIMGEGESVETLRTFLDTLKDAIEPGSQLLLRTWHENPDLDIQDLSKRGVLLSKVMDDVWSYNWLMDIEGPLQADFSALDCLPGVSLPLSFGETTELPDNLIEAYYSELPAMAAPSSEPEPIPDSSHTLASSPTDTPVPSSSSSSSSSYSSSSSSSSYAMSAPITIESGWLSNQRFVMMPAEHGLNPSLPSCFLDEAGEPLFETRIMPDGRTIRGSASAQEAAIANEGVDKEGIPYVRNRPFETLMETYLERMEAYRLDPDPEKFKAWLEEFLQSDAVADGIVGESFASRDETGRLVIAPSTLLVQERDLTRQVFVPVASDSGMQRNNVRLANGQVFAPENVVFSQALVAIAHIPAIYQRAQMTSTSSGRTKVNPADVSDYKYYLDIYREVQGHYERLDRIINNHPLRRAARSQEEKHQAEMTITSQFLNDTNITPENKAFLRHYHNEHRTWSTRQSEAIENMNRLQAQHAGLGAGVIAQMAARETLPADYLPVGSPQYQRDFQAYLHLSVYREVMIAITDHLRTQGSHQAQDTLLVLGQTVEADIRHAKTYLNTKYRGNLSVYDEQMKKALREELKTMVADSDWKDSLQNPRVILAALTGMVERTSARDPFDLRNMLPMIRQAFSSASKSPARTQPDDVFGQLDNLARQLITGQLQLNRLAVATGAKNYHATAAPLVSSSASSSTSSSTSTAMPSSSSTSPAYPAEMQNPVNVSADTLTIMNARRQPRSPAGSSSSYGSSSSTSGFAPDYDYLFKVKLVGDPGVGKSCLLLRYADNTFTDSYISTIGVDFKVRTEQMAGRTTKLQIWDTVGQERFKNMLHGYSRGAHAIVVCFDFTDRHSFEHIRHWLREVERYDTEGVPVVIVGNKIDLVSTDANPVSFTEFQAFCEDVGHPGVATSSKDDVNVDLAFQIVAASALAKTLLPEQITEMTAQPQVSEAASPVATSKGGFFAPLKRLFGGGTPSDAPTPPSSSGGKR